MRALIVAILLLIAPPAFAGLQEEVLLNSQKYLGVTEITPNRSPEIDRFHDYCGLPYGNSWCMLFVLYNYKEASDKIKIQQPLPKQPRCSTMWKNVKKNPYKYKVIPASRVKYGVEKLKLADVIIWSHSKHPGQDNWNGHTGIVLYQLNNDSFRSREGNTSSGEVGDQRNGDGVYDRNRTLGIGTKFQVEGFIRVK